jgi:hypothetical protein
LGWEPEIRDGLDEMRYLRLAQRIAGVLLVVGMERPFRLERSRLAQSSSGCELNMESGEGQGRMGTVDGRGNGYSS